MTGRGAAIRGIVFDFDGVIVNSEPLHFRAFEEAARGVGIELGQEEYYEQLVGYDDRGAWKKLLTSREIDPTPQVLLELLAFKSRVMRSQIQAGTFKAMPGAAELVRSLWREHPLAICSGAIREEIDGMLEGLALRDCFRCITAAEDVALGKPDPSGYVQTIKELGRLSKLSLTPQNVLIVEDSPRVIENVTRLGFRVLGVAGSFRAGDLKQAGADAVVSELSWSTVMAACKDGGIPLKLNA